MTENNCNQEIANALYAIADAIKTLRTEPQKDEKEQPEKPNAEPTTNYTRAAITEAAVKLLDEGKQDKLLALLTAYDVQALTQLPDSDLQKFAAELINMGAVFDETNN